MDNSHVLDSVFNYCDQLADRLDEHQKRLNIQRDEIKTLQKQIEQLEKNTVKITFDN